MKKKHMKLRKRLQKLWTKGDNASKNAEVAWEAN
jgi:hypothetical protein